MAMESKRAAFSPALSCSDLEFYQELGLSCSSFIVKDRMESDSDSQGEQEVRVDCDSEEAEQEERKKSFSRSSTIETVETILR